MQFLYADGTDAHFMDSERYEQIAIPEARSPTPLRWIKPSDEVDVLFIDEQPVGHPAAERGRARGHADRAGRQGRHGLGRRHQAGDARDRRDHPGAAVRRTGERVRVDTRSRRVRVARVGPSVGRLAMRRTDQRRAAVFALYQHDLTGRPLDDAASRATRRRSRARSRSDGRAPRGARRADRAPRRGLDARPDRAAGARDPARRAARDAAPRRWSRATRRSRPRARSTRRSRPPRLLRRRGARLRQRHPRAVLREVRENRARR